MSEQWRPVEKRIDLPAITIANRGAYLEIPDIACTLPDGLRVCEPLAQEDAPTPRPIKSEADHEAALKRIEALMDAEPGTPEEEELQHWAILVHDYEESKYPVPYAGLSSEWNHAIIEGCKFPAIDFDGTGSRKETPYRCRMGQAVGYGATAEEAIRNAYAVWTEGRETVVGNG